MQDAANPTKMAETIEDPSINGIVDRRESTLLSRAIHTQEFWISVAVIIIGVVVAFVAPHFATYTNLGNVLQNFCFIGILAIGMTPILISGGIDISVGSQLGLCGVALGLMLQANCPLWLGMICTLLSGAGLGAINGFFVAYVRLPPFLVTLGMLSVARSMTLIVSNGEAVYNYGQAENAIIALGGGKTLGLANVVYALIAVAILLQ